MKACNFRGCGKSFGDTEHLDWDHFYCPSCGEVIHFNCREIDRHLGTCLRCSFRIEEFNNGKVVWIKDGRVVHVFKADESETRQAVKDRAASREY